jgi:hypothetical protein
VEGEHGERGVNKNDAAMKIPLHCPELILMIRTWLLHQKEIVTASVAERVPRPGRPLLFLGLALPIVGLMGYVLQIAAAHRLFTPWYMPAAAGAGVLLIVLSLWKARSVTRVLALLLVLLLGAAESAFVLGLRAPEYSGPLVVGQPIPAFATALADGTPFTQRHLQGSQNSVLVFFRGRW